MEEERWEREINFFFFLEEGTGKRVNSKIFSTQKLCEVNWKNEGIAT